jgi:hypothetical protein
MTANRTPIGLDVEEALKEVLAYTRGEPNNIEVRTVEVHPSDAAKARSSRKTRKTRDAR